MLGRIAKGIGKLIGTIGAAAWSGLGVYSLVAVVKEQIETHNKKHWQAGYDSAKKEIDSLRKENARLLEEAYKRERAAE